MTEIDVAIARLQNRRLDINAQIADLQHTLAGLDGELRGLEHAKELFSPPESAGRLDVQGPVMALFASAAGTPFREADVIGETELPAVSVHKFLLRAVRDGKLVCQEGVYSLPATPSARAAE